MKHKKGYNLQKYRGLKRREVRKQKQLSRGEIDNKILELKRHKTLEFFVKDVDDDFTPTGYIIVEFNLKDKMTLEAFRNMMYMMVVGWL